MDYLSPVDVPVSNDDFVFFADGEENHAILSGCRTYRYALTRMWGEGPCVTWLMLNPSKADATINDATIRKCIGFSKRWGYGRMIVLNLFALRSTDPRALARSTDAVGPLNDYYLFEAMRETRELVCAWGCQQHMRNATLATRPREVLRAIPEHVKLSCLGLRQDGAPRHPLMLAYATERTPFIYL